MASIVPVIRTEPSPRPLDQVAERAVVSPTLSSAVTARASTPAGSSEMRREQGSDHARSDRAREAESQRKALTQNAIAEIKGENKRNKPSDANAGGTSNGAPGEVSPSDMVLLLREPPRLPPQPDTRPIVIRDGVVDHITIRDIQELVVPHLLAPSTTALKGYESASRDFVVSSLNIKS